ncbi:AbrB family transcriptional regulator [Roseiarcus sp.]|uniref:AbrB family transcriptional regulator n=1 Tax=Roseiarcus sp. TaxID=1969460 RepID=UPI003F944099
MRNRLKLAAQWGVLLALTALLVGGLELLRLPAALLLGSLAAAASLTAADVEVHVPRPLFAGAQAIVGCLIARVIMPSTMREMAHDWPTFLGGVLSVIAVSAALGWLLARLRVLPGSTAVWGAFPGAATVMTLMAEGFGADVRLVALMQYLRVVMVAIVATVVASLWTATTSHAAAPVDWFPSVARPSLAATLVLAAAAAAIGQTFRIPAGPMLLALGAAAVMQNTGAMRIELPPWLLAPAYCAVGWSIGARFNRPILIHAVKVLPALMASILSLLAICGGLAAILAQVAHVDALTAYLAMSPGGADSVAIIAASTHVDMPFIMSMQMARFLIVLVLGPAIARFVAGPQKGDSLPSAAGVVVRKV